jgi:hypothetical protein
LCCFVLIRQLGSDNRAHTRAPCGSALLLLLLLCRCTREVRFSSIATSFCPSLISRPPPLLFSSLLFSVRLRLVSPVVRPSDEDSRCVLHVVEWRRHVSRQLSRFMSRHSNRMFDESDTNEHTTEDTSTEQQRQRARERASKQARAHTTNTTMTASERSHDHNTTHATQQEQHATADQGHTVEGSERAVHPTEP